MTSQLVAFAGIGRFGDFLREKEFLIASKFSGDDLSPGEMLLSSMFLITSCTLVVGCILTVSRKLLSLEVLIHRLVCPSILTLGGGGGEDGKGVLLDRHGLASLVVHAGGFLRVGIVLGLLVCILG